MRRSVFVVFFTVVGCAALGAVPSTDYELAQSRSDTIQEALLFSEVPTKLHAVLKRGGNDIVQFLLKPNDFQTCACNVRGGRITCACISPAAGICLETRL
jgi:hypothetical protein